MLPIVDTHQHQWDSSLFDLPWTAGAGALGKDHLMSDYVAAVEGLNVIKSVYMEVDVSPAQRRAEAEYVIELCERNDNPMSGAVIAGDPSADDFEEHVRRFAGNPYIKGIRLVLHPPEAEPGKCLGDRFVEGVQLLGQLGLSFDICLRPAEQSDGVALVDRCPDTQFIINHCGNADPQVVSGALSPTAEELQQNPFSHTRDQWAGDMAEYAKRDNVICKISGIVARAPEDWTAADLAPAIDYCLDTFGPDRVIFASDWPVCTLRASLEQWVQALLETISSRSEEQQRKLLCDNALRIYSLS